METINFIENPSIETQAPIATHITVESAFYEATASLDNISPEEKIDRTVQIERGGTGICQEVADKLLEKWGRERVKVTGQINLNLSIDFKNKVHVVIPEANIDEELTVLKITHNISNGTTDLELGDPILDDDELLSRILEDISVNQIPQDYYGELSRKDEVTWDNDLIDIPARFEPPTEQSQGLFVTETEMGFYDNEQVPAWRTYMDNKGNFYLGGQDNGALLWDAENEELIIDGDGYFSGELQSATGKFGDDNQYVKYEDGKLSIVGSVFQSNPDADEGPIPVYRGSWDNSKVYYYGDVVSRAGSTFIWNSTDPVSGTEPPSGDWEYHAERGEPFNVDEQGDLSDRDQYDDEAEGFAYLATDTGDLYIKNSDTSGDWSDAIPFRGEDGTDGADSKILNLSYSSQSYKFDEDGQPLSPDDIYFFANAQNIDQDIVWVTDPSDLNLQVNGDNATLNINDFADKVSEPGDTVEITVESDDGAYSDNVIIYALQNGSNAIITKLSNDNHTVPADYDGSNPDLTNAETEVKIYKGTVNITPDWTITKSDSTGVDSTLDGNVITVDSLTANSATITITATHDPNMYEDEEVVFSLSKSLTGQDGDSAPFLEAEYSSDQETWYDTYQEGRIWMRTSSDGGSSWSEPVRIEGEEGKEGDFVEFRFNKSTDPESPPSLSSSSREPSGWDETPPSLDVDEYLWKTKAKIDGETDDLIGVWSDPTRLTGLKGEDGEDGTDGVDGEDGKGVVYRGLWNSDDDYYNLDNRQDVVEYGGEYWVCEVTNSGQTPSSSSSYWSNFGADFESVATDILLAQETTIRERLNVGSGDNDNYAGIIGTGTASDSVRIWAGNSDPSIAPLRITQDGSIHASSFELESNRLTMTDNEFNYYISGSSMNLDGDGISINTDDFILNKDGSAEFAGTLTASGEVHLSQIGEGASADSGSIAFGDDSLALDTSISIGHDSRGEKRNIAIGNNTVLYNIDYDDVVYDSIAIGNNISVADNNVIAIGNSLDIGDEFDYDIYIGDLIKAGNRKFEVSDIFSIDSVADPSEVSFGDDEVLLKGVRTIGDEDDYLSIKSSYSSIQFKNASAYPTSISFNRNMNDVDEHPFGARRHSAFIHGSSLLTFTTQNSITDSADIAELNGFSFEAMDGVANFYDLIRTEPDYVSSDPGTKIYTELQVLGDTYIGENGDNGTDLTITGTMEASSKNFKINHPNPDKEEDYYLKHSAVESPTEGDNLYRYKITADKDNDKVIVDLPDYFKYLNKDVQVWVNAVEHFGNGYGKVKDNKLEVHCELEGEYNILVIGTRKDEKALENWNGAEIKKDEDKYTKYSKRIDPKTGKRPELTEEEIEAIKENTKR